MFEYLAAYLAAVCPPEQRDRLLTGCELLSALGIEGHAFAIDQELELAENADTSVTLQSIEAIVIETARAVLTQFGVDVEDNLPLGLVTDILKSLEGLTNYADHDTIVSIIDQNLDPIETLATLLPLLGENHTDDYLQAITAVGIDVIFRLKEINDIPGEEFDNLPAREVIDRARARLRSFIKKHPGLLIEKAIREEEMRLGGDVQDMITELYMSITHLTPAAFGREIVAIYLASGEEDTDVHPKVLAEIGEHYADLRSAASANQSALQALSEVTYG